MNSYRILEEKIANGQVKICIVGLGYVGLPLAVAFAKKGYAVTGLDNSRSRVERLKKGENYIVDVESKEILSLIKRKKFSPTTNQKVLATSDVIIICVPTPLRKVKIPDISYVVAASKTIKKYLIQTQLVILESTSYPTTTREVVLPILRKTGFKEEKDFFLCFSPERVNPGDKKFPLTKIPKIVGGLSNKSSKLAKSLYSKIIKDVFTVSSPEVAESSKLLENTFRLVNIALVNEFAMVAEKLGINMWEVVEAAKTKPFGFMPFYPGPGIGGHCLAQGEVIMVKNDKNKMALNTFSELFDAADSASAHKRLLNGVNYVKPKNFKILSFDFQKKKPVFKNIELMSKRKANTKGLQVITNDNRKLTLTDKHPMVIKKGSNFTFKWAKDLVEGDQIPFITSLPNISNLSVKSICMLDYLKKDILREKLRIKPKVFQWSKFKEELKQLNIRSEKKRDYLRGNYLPLELYLKASEQSLLNLNPDLLLICSGRGPSFIEIPASIRLNGDFWRLVGYYISEGCISKDKSLRVRFTFNVDEKETIEDIKGILANMGIRFSTYCSKKDKVFHLKVSSNVFGYLFRDILKCGVNSYTMRIPDILFSQPSDNKKELLKGMFRGDGGVDISIGKRRYFKNKKEYCHNKCTANVNYYSISNILFQQLIYLLQSEGIVPIFKKRDNILLVAGHTQLKKFEDIFIDNKKDKLDKYFEAHSKNIPNRSFAQYDNFAVSKVRRISKRHLDYVYSVEVRDTNIFATSYGMIVHNCIPADPLYLSWKSKRLGFKTKMIDLAAYMDHFMPKYTAGRVVKLLKTKGVSISKAKVLILGVTYKKDVKDLRESPALDIIEELRKRKTKVDYSDHLIPCLKINGINLKSVSLNRDQLRKYDCLVIITNHSKVNYEFLRRNATLIFDTRNVYKKDYNNVIRL